MISEKGLCKILKSAYKRGGYTIVPRTIHREGPAGTYRHNDIIINGTTWAIECETIDLPSKAAVQIVEDAGYLPVEAMTIKKGEPNQLVLEGTASSRHELLAEQRGDLIRMKKIPVIFKERWQLYQTERGSVHAFDTTLLELIDFERWKPESFMSAAGHLGVFISPCEEQTVYIAPGRFSAADEEKVLHIAGLDWEQQMEHDDPAVNVSLFDEDADEPLADAEE